MTEPLDLKRPLARPNTFEIDLDAIAGCVAAIRRQIGPSTYFFATVKANGYGFGVVPAARAALAAGADALSLVSLEDAVALRRSGVTAPILLYAGVPPEHEVVEAMEAFDLTPTIYSEETLAAYARHLRAPRKVAVKIDVGAERIGIPGPEALSFVRSVARHDNLKVEILNAHPNVPKSERARDIVEWQYRRFMEVCAEVERAGVSVPLRVFAGSKVLRSTDDTMLLNAVDPGEALFRPLVSGAVAEGGQAFAALRSRLIQVRGTFRSEYLEEAPFPIAQDMRVGIIPIGYSDGMARLHSGVVLVHGRRVPVLGAPALEYTRIDLTHVPEAAVGDEVVIVGRQGDDRISPEEVVAHQSLGRVADLALLIGPTVVRRYMGRRRDAEVAGVT